MRGKDSFSRHISAEFPVGSAYTGIGIPFPLECGALQAVASALELMNEPAALLSSSARVLVANSSFAAVTGAGVGAALGERITAKSWVRLSALLSTASKGLQADLHAELLGCNDECIAIGATASPFYPPVPGETDCVLLRLGPGSRGLEPDGHESGGAWKHHFPDRLDFIRTGTDHEELLERLEALVQRPLSRGELIKALEIMRTKGLAVLYPCGADQEKAASHSGAAHATELRLVAIAPSPEGEAGVLAIARDGVIDPAKAERDWQLARQDALTGLSNRRAFEALLQRDFASVVSGNHEYLALLYVDLDGFKMVNDQGGHEAGDMMLREVAKALKGTAAQHGEADLAIGRLGGDEFAISCPVTCHKDGLDMAWRVLEAIAGISFDRGETTFRIGASIGVTMVHASDCKAGVTAADILHRADMASLAGKKIDEPTVFHAPSVAAEPERIWRPGRIHAGSAAPKAGELDLFVQPIRLLANGRLAASEVLLRTPGKGRGKQSPLELVKAAERRGYVSRIDCWVLDRVIDHLASAPVRTPLSVNICGQSAASGELWQMLRARVGKDPVLARSLCLELREADLLADVEGIGSFMKRASGLGCQLAIDSFGGGWSAVSTALDIKVDWLKLDESLTKQLAGAPVLARITRPLVRQLAKTGIRSIAKSVETIEEYENLKALGITAVQGYLIGRPQRMSADCKAAR